MKKDITPSSPLLSLSKRWSWRALEWIAFLPPDSTIVDLYHTHWLNMGRHIWRGFSGTERRDLWIGPKTFEKMRQFLMRRGFPDLESKMFRPDGTCRRCCPRNLLEDALGKWKKASSKKRAELRRKIAECSCDGH